VRDDAETTVAGNLKRPPVRRGRIPHLPSAQPEPNNATIPVAHRDPGALLGDLRIKLAVNVRGFGLCAPGADCVVMRLLVVSRLVWEVWTWPAAN
jgi:hypothetical protein